jgi:hypothetical protein
MIIESCCEQMLDLYKRKIVHLNNDNKYTIEMVAYIGTPGGVGWSEQIYFCPFCGKAMQFVQKLEK